MNRKRVGFWVVIVSIAVAPITIALSYVVFNRPFDFPDFGAYYYAAQRFLHDAPLYSNQVPGPQSDLLIRARVNSWIYPPIAVLVFLPFTLFDPVVATALYLLLDFAVLVGGVTYLTGILWPSWEFRRHFAIGLLSPGSFPALAAFRWGQITPVLVGVTSLAIGIGWKASVETDGRDRLMTALLVGVAAIKPVYSPSGLVTTQRRRQFASLLIASVSMLVLSLLLLGLSVHQEYLSVIVERLSMAKAGGFSPWYFDPLDPIPLGNAALRILIAVALVGIAVVNRGAADDASYLSVAALGLLGVVFLSPETGVVLTLLTVPVFLLTMKVEEVRGSERYLVVILGGLLVHWHYPLVTAVFIILPRIGVPLGSAAGLYPYVQPAILGGLMLGWCLVTQLEIPTPETLRTALHERG